MLTVGIDNFLQTLSLKYREIGNRALAGGDYKIKKNLLKQGRCQNGKRGNSPKSKDLAKRIKQWDTEICEELALVKKGEEDGWGPIGVCNLVV